MAIQNINGSYSSSAVANSSSRKGISGLASGLNTDEIIDALTSNTQGKIAKLQQDQQKVAWKTDAYRSITDKLIGFSQKYLSSSSSTNMLNPNFFENATILSKGDYADKVSIKGSSSSIKDFQVNSIKKLATTASMTASNTVSSQSFQTEVLSDEMFNSGKAIIKLEGESINISYNHTRYDIRLNDIAIPPQMEADQKAAVTQFEKVYQAEYDKLKGQSQSDEAAHTGAIAVAKDTDLTGKPGVKLGEKLKDISDGVRGNVIDAVNRGIEQAGLKGKLEAQYDQSSHTFGLKVLDDGNSGLNATLSISGIGKNASNYLGISAGASASEGQTLKGQTLLNDEASVMGAVDVMDMKESLSGKSFVLDLDGVKKTITLNDYSKDNSAPSFTFATVAKDIAVKVKKAFGGRIAVDTTGNHLKFFAGSTQNPNTTSILSVASGDRQLTQALGLKVGSANRLLLDDSLESLSGQNLSGGLSTIFAKGAIARAQFDADGSISMDPSSTGSVAILQVNQTRFEVYGNAIRITGADGKVKNIRSDSGITMRNLMDAVNNSDAGVNMKYNSTTDNFTVTAKESGSYGHVDFNGTLSEALFGGTNTQTTTNGGDAEIEVSFDGGKSSATITRSSNTFSLNGMNLTLNGTFEGTAVDPTGAAVQKPVTFEAKMNTDDIMKNISDMVSDYNDIIKLVNDEFSTKPDSKYPPLSDAQRKQMSADQIKEWNEKAKAGSLFNDPDLAGLASDIRFAFSFPVDGEMLSSIGISTSKNWEDNGKLTIDENALQKALQERPDDVVSLFSKKSDGHSDGGAMTRLKSVMDKYAATSGDKGILVNKAGNAASPLSMMQNSMQTQMDGITRQIQEMQRQLKTEQDRYYKQFSNLEVYISKMNAQSGWMQQQQQGS